MRKLLMVGLAFMLLSLSCAVADAAPKMKVGKALKATVSVVSAPVRHPKSAIQAAFKFSYTGFLASVEAVGVVVEGVGLGIEKVGTVVYGVGSVLSGGK